MLVKEKVEQAVSILKELDVDCWLTFTRESQINGDPSLAFLLDGDVTWHTALIVTSSGDTRAIAGRYDVKAIEDVGAYRQVVGYVEGIREPLLAAIREIDPKTIAVNFSQDSEICDGLTHGMYLALHGLLAEIGCAERLVSAERVVSALRQRKTAAEIQAIRRAVRAAEVIFDEAAGFIRPGVTEQEIARFMQDAAKKAGHDLAWEARACPSVFTGPETAGAHYAPTGRAVERGHIVNMDFGVKALGYCSDLQRTYYVLEEGEASAPAEVWKGFDAVVEAIDRARRALKPGALGHEVDAVARRHVVESGFEEFPHALGHQVGRFSHDGTALLGPPWEKYARKPFQPIEAGMVFTLEPRVTVPGRGIATIEEMVLVKQGGSEYLSTPQVELVLI
ncbi:MAG: aminopeptidase P family protein [Planctomycetes bacterium]|nr:aminopeptidase P family protein [Planctomycetota bacterium]